MKHFIINFAVTINGKNTYVDQIGAVVEYNPNIMKSTITEQYRKRYPEAKTVAVVITDVEPVTKEQYDAAVTFFIELI